MDMGAGIKQQSRGREDKIRWAVRSTADVGEVRKAVASVLLRGCG